ncbi:MAG: FG-GAP repeat protein [Bdellovibrionaceae bacterium]|nr:FG-GAP repeat protein [Pseudobdellovibrionaceae bacterium]
MALTTDSLYIGCSVCGDNQSGVVFRKLLSNIESSTVSNRDINKFINFSQDNTNTESFGQSLVSDGVSTIMVGAPSKDTPSLKSGAAYIYNVR